MPLSYRNSFPFWLFPFLKIWGTLSQTNCGKNSPFMFFKSKTFNYNCAMGNGNHKLGNTSYSPFFFAVLVAFLIQLLLFWCPCWHGSVLQTLQLVPARQEDIPLIQKFGGNALHFFTLQNTNLLKIPRKKALGNLNITSSILRHKTK